VVMANLVHGVDGRWSACDQRGLTAHRRSAAAVYEAQLRQQLGASLGVAWSHAPMTPAEVRGIPPMAMGEFSSRSSAIRRHMFERGTSSARSNRIAWAVTRPHKVPAIAFDELADEWTRRAASVGVTRADVHDLFGQAMPDHPTVSEHEFAAALSVAPDGGARRRDVVRAFATASPDGMSSDTLAELTDLWVPTPASPQVGVAEGVHQRRAMLPSPYELRTLGARPADGPSHLVWRAAAADLGAYRARWGVTEAHDAWGVEGGAGLSTVSTARLVDHLRTAHRVEVARGRLGRREPTVLELDRGR